MQFTKSILQYASAILVRFVLHFTLFIRLLFLLQAHLAYDSVCVSAYNRCRALMYKSVTVQMFVAVAVGKFF